MPNWCENILVIEGAEAEVKRFIAENSDPLASEESAQLLSFEMALPTPQSKEGDANDHWFHWRNANWGTKWNASDVTAWDIFDYSPKTSARCEFLTAWSPPLAWLGAVGARFPELVIQLDYVEHAMRFSGSAVVSDGKLFDEEVDYDAADYGLDYEEDEEA